MGNLALRVCQADSIRLETGLVELLGARVNDVIDALDLTFPRLRLRSFTRDWSAELEAAALTALLCVTVGRTGATFGQQLYNLRLATPSSLPTLSSQRAAGGQQRRRLLIPPSRRRTAIYIALVVLARWAEQRVQQLMMSYGWHASADNSWRRRLYLAWGRLQKMSRLLSFISNFGFVLGGTAHPNLIARLCGLRLVYASGGRVPPDYLAISRDYIWQALGEMAFYLAPASNMAFFRHTWQGIGLAMRTLGGVGAAKTAKTTRKEQESKKKEHSSGDSRADNMKIQQLPRERDGNGKVESVVLSSKTSATTGTTCISGDRLEMPGALACCSCGSDPANAACVAACGHVHCYVCAITRCMELDGFLCDKCGRAIHASDLTRLVGARDRDVSDSSSKKEL